MPAGVITCQLRAFRWPPEVKTVLERRILQSIMYLAAPVGFAVIVYTALLTRLTGSQCPAPRRHAFLGAAIVAGVAVAVITEALSAIQALSTLPLFASWTVLAGLAALALRRRLAVPNRPLFGPANLTKVGWIALIGLLGILGVTFLIALLAPPNTWDSMTYHMSRVMHWEQNRHVGFFATSEPRELWVYPWSEFAILHLQLLSGGDRFANLVQWIASAISATGVSLIARQFAARPTAQIAAALLAVSAPMAIMESTSTQTDYVAGGWLVCAVYFSLLASKHPTRWLVCSVAAGCSLGAGLLAKPTIALFFPAFFVWAALRNGGVRRLGAGTKSAAVIASLGLALCSGHLIRLQDFPSDDQAARVANAELSPRVLASNALRSLTLHTGTRWDDFNQQQEKIVAWLHEPLGLDVSDPLTTQAPGYVFYRVHRARHHEDWAGNPLHLALFLVALPLCLWLARRNRRARDVLYYGLCIVAGSLVLFLIARWSPWNSRFHLPLFLLCAPFVSVTLGWLLRGKAAAILPIALILSAVPGLLKNESRPLLGPRSILSLPRDRLLFNNRPDLYEDYVAGIKRLEDSGCRDIGLVLHGESWEYPIWKLASARAPHPTIRHVTFHPHTVQYAPDIVEPPCAIFAYSEAEPTLAVGGESFTREWESTNLSFYLPASR